MKLSTGVQLACLSAAMVACNSTPHAEGVPALLVSPDATARSELQRALAELLNTDSVTLADDAFTRSSSLIIERSRLSGRETGTPEHFHLLLDDGGCFLVRQTTAESALLAHVECRAAP